MKRLSILSLLTITLTTPGFSALAQENATGPAIQVETRRMPLDQESVNEESSAPIQRARPYSNAQPSQVNPQQSVRPMGQREQTLSIIKPDAVEANHIGDIISRFEKSGLRIAGIKMVFLTKEQAGEFYQVHRERPFYPELVKFMSSGPVVVLLLEGENAIAKNRRLMGATNPQQAEQGTIRSDFAESVSRNAVHGSDSSQAAQEEINFFFTPNEIFKRG